MLEKIIRKYYDEIFRYCYHHVESRSLAEDLCQDTFLSFIEHYDEYHPIGKTKNYLYTIAKNKCRDYYKKKAPIFMENVPEQESDKCIEESVIIKQMVMSLPEELGEAVMLRYFQNMQYKDIAAILNIKLSLAKYRVKRGVELLSAMEGGAHGTTKN
ncbi:MAG: RNA polymerase sigma factor [Lachnospiraceae bacterium]|nr:RNA polymerase sigma factor [Lachnospiraceae bacterium]